MKKGGSLFRDKSVLITGGDSGLGLGAAITFGTQRNRILLACKDLGKAQIAKEEIMKRSGYWNITPLSLDLGNLHSMKEFVDIWKRNPYPIDVMINNAGICSSDFVQTKDGFESNMGINHLGHFYITNQLLEHFREDAKIVIVTSANHKYAKLDVENPIMNQSNFSKKYAYSNSKLANLLFAVEMQNRLLKDPRRITCSAIDPGGIRSNFFSNVPFYVRMLASMFSVDPVQASEVLLHLAAEESSVPSGSYYLKESIVPIKQNHSAESFWNVSQKLIEDALKRLDSVEPLQEKL